MALWEVLAPKRPLTTSKNARWFTNLTITFGNAAILRVDFPISPAGVAIWGALAAGAATALGYVLSDRVFQIPFSANPMVWLYGVGGGALVVTLAGWLGTRGTLRQPPLTVIRQLG